MTGVDVLVTPGLTYVGKTSNVSARISAIVVEIGLFGKNVARFSNPSLPNPFDSPCSPTTNPAYCSPIKPTKY